MPCSWPLHSSHFSSLCPPWRRSESHHTRKKQSHGCYRDITNVSEIDFLKFVNWLGIVGNKNQDYLNQVFFLVFFYLQAMLALNVKLLSLELIPSRPKPSILHAMKLQLMCVIFFSVKDIECIGLFYPTHVNTQCTHRYIQFLSEIIFHTQKTTTK